MASHLCFIFSLTVLLSGCLGSPLSQLPPQQKQNYGTTGRHYFSLMKGSDSVTSSRKTGPSLPRGAASPKQHEFTGPARTSYPLSALGSKSTAAVPSRTALQHFLKLTMPSSKPQPSVNADLNHRLPQSTSLLGGSSLRLPSGAASPLQRKSAVKSRGLAPPSVRSSSSTRTVGQRTSHVSSGSRYRPVQTTRQRASQRPAEHTLTSPSRDNPTSISHQQSQASSSRSGIRFWQSRYSVADSVRPKQSPKSSKTLSSISAAIAKLKQQYINLILCLTSSKSQAGVNKVTGVTAERPRQGPSIGFPSRYRTPVSGASKHSRSKSNTNLSAARDLDCETMPEILSLDLPAHHPMRCDGRCPAGRVCRMLNNVGLCCPPSVTEWAIRSKGQLARSEMTGRV